MVANRALYAARMRRGWSQAILANKLETSAKNVGRWERGETFPSPYYRERLCQLFDLDAEALGLLPSSTGNTLAATNVEKLKPHSSPVSPPSLNNTQRFIEHEALLHDLVEQVQPGSAVALTGLPGSGKTALLQTLIQHPQIQERFPDGIIWIGLGPTPDLPHRIIWLARLLGSSTFTMEQGYSEEHWLLFLREAIFTQHLLLVLDDVWAMEATFPFLIRSPSVAYVLSTRLPKVAIALATREPFVVPPLSLETSQHLLTTLAPCLKSIDERLLGQITALTGGLPLAITLIGKYLASHSYGGQLRRLEMALNQIMDLAYRLHLSIPLPSANFSRAQDNDIVCSLDTTIALSDHHLPPLAQTALRALSVLPRGPFSFSEDAALAITATGLEVLDLLVDAGLLEPAEKHSYRMHPVISDYACYHRGERAPQIRLVEYMKNICVDHGTNMTLLEREYATLLAGIDAAATLEMHNELIRGVLTLIPLMRLRGFYTEADQSLRKALHSAIFLQDQSLCQKILDELATFAQLRHDDAQSSAYLSLGKILSRLHARQSDLHPFFANLQKTVRIQVETPRRNIL